MLGQLEYTVHRAVANSKRDSASKTKRALRTITLDQQFSTFGLRPFAGVGQNDPSTGVT